MPITETLARDNLKRLLDDFDKLTADERKTMSEASVVRQFIDRLLEEVLGWPIKDPQRYKYEMNTQAGRPDLTLFPEQGGVIFVEAKRFGVIKELEQSRYTVQGVITPGQMALPGMAVDRTAEEQQAINYAFANGGTWAILSSFERLRLFNARRDWLVLSFERPGAYLTEFDQLWQLSYESVLNGSLDALSNQRYARDIDNAYLDFVNEWRLKLAQDVVTRRSLNRWAFTGQGAIDLTRLRAVVQRFLDRLVIARFAEDWLVIPPGTLRQFADMRRNNIYTHSMDSFLDQFFRRFDGEHNSALFSYDRTDDAIFSDATLMPLIDKLYEVRYRAMPADILGNTYEQYLGKALALSNGSVTTRDNLETRKKQGSYYTPQVIVQYIVDNSLGRTLYGTENGKADGKPLPGETRKTSVDIRDLKVLDSACGSGSFLIYAYKVLAEFYETEVGRLKADYETRVREMAANFDKISLDDRIAAERIQQEQERLRNYPRLILETHLYGVDLDPAAAEIATVNLMMRAMEGQHREKRLPLILGQNVKVGNGLVGLVYPHPPAPSPSGRGGEKHPTRQEGEGESSEEFDYRAAIADLMARRKLLTTDPDKGKPQPEIRRNPFYDLAEDEVAKIPNYKLHEEARAYIRQRDAQPIPEDDEFEDPAHETANALRRATRVVAQQLNALLAPHFTDLERVRPFHWGVEFPEAFYNEDGSLKDNPGFTIVFGNPPWEILKPDLREFYAQFDERIESKLNRAQAEQRIAELEAEDPRRRADFDALNASVSETTTYLRANGDYNRQGRGDAATHKLFLERMYGLLQNDGRLGYVVPSGIYTDLGTKDLREMLLNEGSIQYIYSFSNERFFFPGVHHSFKFVLLGAHKGTQSDGFWAAFRFNPRVAVAPDDLPAFLGNANNLIYVRRDSLQRFSPESLSVMEFQSKRDYDVAERIYGEWPLLGDEVENTWTVKFTNEFHMTNDRHLFNTEKRGLSLYEGKMIHQYEAFYDEPQYWIEEQKGAKELVGRTDYSLPRLVVRTIARSTDTHTLISTIVPGHTFCGNSLYVERIGTTLEPKTKLYCQALLNSFVLDWLLRLKVAANVNLFYLYSLPLPRLTAGHPAFDAIVPRAARLTCTRPEFAGLWESVMGTPYPLPLPNTGNPLPNPPPNTGEGVRPAVDPVERQQLRDEIDGLVAHVYGLTRAEYDHILGTFPLVFPDSDEGRAKRATALAAYDAAG